MNKELHIYYTSDIHGYFSPVDHATGGLQNSGLANCMANYKIDGNTLVLDGGDTLQGSPLTYYLYNQDRGGECIPAQIMNLAGYRFITPGNHDFDYGKEELERYLRALDARCLCANVEGLAGAEKSATVVLENGLRVGLTGVTSHFVRRWEKAEKLAGLTIRDAYEAAHEQAKLLRRAGCDITVCIYHGGYERNLQTGELLSQSGENQGWRIAAEAGFDILLCAHQHMVTEGQYIGRCFTCQGDDKARHYLKVDAALAPDGHLQVNSRLEEAGDTPLPAAWDLLQPLEQAAAAWLDEPVGQLDISLQPQDHLTMAAYGSSIANFFNQVQLAASGADISVTSLANTLRGFERSVSIRDVVASYVFPNTLKTIEVTRPVLKQALERCAEYFDRDESGKLCISHSFLQPLVQHYNYDYFSGIAVTMDLRRPMGDRVVSIQYQGEELPETKKLALCLNNYRASGAGGYEVYRQCPLLQEQPTEIAELIMDHIRQERDICVDKTKWLTIIE